METPTTTIPPLLLACPRCPKCGTRMLLVRIYPDRPGSEQRTYQSVRTATMNWERLSGLRRAG